MDSIRYNHLVVSKDRQYVLLSGLPRTGATVLSNIFAQNPEVHFGGHSALPSLLHGINHTVEVTANENLVMLDRYDGFKEKAMQMMLDLYHGDVQSPVIIDKGRTWACEANRGYADLALGSNTKYIILVRPIDEIVQSFASLRVKNGWEGNIFRDLLNPNDDPILWPLNGVIHSAFCDFPNTLFISYDDIIYDTHSVVKRIERFVGLKSFNYRYNDIQETVSHNDAFIDLEGLHEVRPTISRRRHDIVLPDDIKMQCQKYNKQMLDLGINLGRSLKVNHGALC